MHQMTCRRALICAAGMLALAAATPAFARFGAVAYDQNNGSYGASFDQPSQTQAFEKALRQCASPGCRVHPVEPKGCGALAVSGRDKAWGGADRTSLAAAKRDAMTLCQRHALAGSCTVRVFGCNR
jgi:hypothetical protein